MKENRDKVIVIIASYNARNYWPDLLPRLVAEQYSDFDMEILVVDNNSTDDSVEYIRGNFPEITVLPQLENIGFAGANNLGYAYAKKAQADFIYLLNQDTIIQPGFLLPLYDFAKNNNFGSLQSKLLLWPDQQKINTAGNNIHFLGFGFGSYSDHQDTDLPIRQINYASGAGVFISMSALSELENLFDETMFMYLEDLDLGWRLKLLGYENYVIPPSIIYHKYSFSRSMKQFFWFERNRLWVLLKNYKIGTLVLIFPAWLLMELGQLIYALKYRRFGSKVRSYGWLFSTKQRRIFAAKRKFIQSRRKVKDREIFKQFSATIDFQPINSLALRAANMIFFAYWNIIRNFIIW